MSLSSTTRFNTYAVLMDNGEDITTEYVLARNSECAAWQALELSIHRNSTLKDVRLVDEW